VKSLLENAIVHLLNGDEDKAEALFHKFMVEKAKQIHESLRQDEEINIDENWDDEIKEEEYFGQDDVEDEDEDETSSDTDMDIEATDDDESSMGDDEAIDDTDIDIDSEDDMDTESGDMGDMKDKLDDIESQIQDLIAQFDAAMGGSDGDDEDGVEMSDDDFETENESAEDFEDENDEDPDLADRMDTDMSSDDGEKDPEHQTMESADMEGDEMMEDDENLDDITESVLAELDRIASPSNTDGKEIGSSGKSVGGNNKSPLPSNSINNRIKGATPYMVKGGDNSNFARETPPASKGVESLVKGAKNSTARSTSKFARMSKEGDSSAKLNSDFAGGGEKKGKSPIDGGKKPVTK
jgi:hypothetical protein